MGTRICGGDGGVESVEPGGGDSDDGHRIVVDQNFLSDDSGAPIEATGPIVVTEDRDGVAAVDLVVFFGVEDAADGGLDAQHTEEIAGDHLGVGALGLVVNAEGTPR